MTFLSRSSKVNSWTKASSSRNDDSTFQSPPSSIQTDSFALQDPSFVPPSTLGERTIAIHDVESPSEVDGRKFTPIREDKHALEMISGFDGTDSTYYQTFRVLGQWRADIPSDLIASGCKVPQELETTDKFNQNRKYFELMEVRVTAGTDPSVLLTEQDSQWKVAELCYGTEETAHLRKMVGIYGKSWADQGTLLTRKVERSVSLVRPDEGRKSRVASWARDRAKEFQISS
jgi:hypothetical protein